MTEGQRLICINDSFSPAVHSLYTNLPVKDQIYTVRAVWPGRGHVAVIGPDGKFIKNGAGDLKPELGILLKELINPDDPWCQGRELGFNAERFAPLETDEEESEAKDDVEINLGAPAFA